MANRQWLYDGQTAGTTISAALAGTGAQTPVVDAGSATFQTASGYQGSSFARFAFTAAGATGVFQPLAPAATSTDHAWTFAFRLGSTVTGNVAATIAQFRTSSTSLYSVRLVWVSGTPTLHLFAGASTDIGQIGTGSITTATWYRVSGVVDGDTGAYTIRLRLGSDDSLIGSAFTGTNAGLVGTINTGTGTAAGIRIGQATGGFAQALTIDIDYVNFNDGGTAEIAAPSNSAPTVDAGVNQNVAAAATVNLTASASDTDGSIASYAWTYDFPASGGPTLTGGTTATPSFTAGSLGALYILRCTVADNLGATAFDTVEVRVPVAGATAMRHVAADGTGVGTWTIAGGSATDGAALSDESDATYVESPTVSGTEQKRRVRLQPTSAKATGQVKEKLWTDTGTAHAVIRLYEGTTLREEWDCDVDTTPAQALSTTPTTFTADLSGGTIAAITDWGNLYVEIGVTS